ncbi:Beta-lactamase hydrolase-like protein [Andreprevotia sp. IGB-42]|uniref:beta-lactamase hydrolase domain-containing protein n=1 Tax=Andreprevotia sp. IGB-42 TaxID=2497473 RepID=UPI00135CDB09|nr:sulfur transferase domain-containing protein [Andreprevotia sp. IGB-42]KAF0815346.1 Beta-lactamase hydrolase-like protein [Andreprevotia sp. IGB-42]
MKRLSNARLFALSILLGLAAVLALFAYGVLTAPPQLNAHLLTADIAVTEQLQLNAVSSVKESGYATIIDLRPDGEAPDQPASADVQTQAHDNQLHFAYVPVPHGDIPAATVDQLATALANSPKPILLYCRSGKRAARTWSLVEASRQGGMDAAAILAAVKASGQSADDLTASIERRIAARGQPAGQTQ